MDAFAVLDFPRAPWVDAEVLKERFHRLSAVRHPDAPGGSDAAFSELNTAWQTLREPTNCLRHFLHLTAPDALATANETPADLGDLFMEIAGLKHAAQQFLAAREKAASPLARALVEPQRLVLLGRTELVEAQVAGRFDDEIATIRTGEASSAHLAAVLGRLTFVANWRHQLADLRLRLTHP